MIYVKEGEHLLNEIKNGSSNSFAKFYDKYSSLVFGIAMKILKNKEDAEDLCQDVFIEIFNNPHSFNPKKGSVEAWIAIKTKSRCLDRLRRRNHTLYNTVDEFLETTADKHLVEEQVIMNSERDMIHKALQELPEQQQEAIIGNFFKGYSHRELADHLNRPLGTIKSLVRYGVNNLRKYFEQHNVLMKPRGEKNDM